jgi:hypothetical protein
MWKARRAQLVGDPEDPLVVDATRLTARRSDKLRFARHRRERSERRRDALPVQRDDLIRRLEAIDESLGGDGPRQLQNAIADALRNL